MTAQRTQFHHELLWSAMKPDPKGNGIDLILADHSDEATLWSVELNIIFGGGDEIATIFDVEFTARASADIVFEMMQKLLPDADHTMVPDR